MVASSPGAAATTQRWRQALVALLIGLLVSMNLVQRPKAGSFVAEKHVQEQQEEANGNHSTTSMQRYLHETHDNASTTPTAVADVVVEAAKVAAAAAESDAAAKAAAAAAAVVAATTNNHSTAAATTATTAVEPLPNNAHADAGSAGAGSATAESSASEASAAPDDDRLNILVLYPDDMRHDSMGMAGTQPVKTPFLDRLAAEGMRFRQNAVTTSICWMSRATLFSGQYVSRHLAYKLGTPIPVSRWNTTYPGILRDHGYYTGHTGKWQFRNKGEVGQYLFDFAGNIADGYHTYRATRHGPMKHITDRNEWDAIQFLKTRPRDRPFSLSVAFVAPKAVGNSDMQWTPMDKTADLYNDTPTLQYPANWNESLHRLPDFFRYNDKAFPPRSRWIERFGNASKYDASMRAYYRMISEVDMACENIVNELKEQGILNKTLIIFTADNGFFHSEHGLAGKWFPYQESIRVPLIIKDPRMPSDKIGTVSDEFTLNIDLASTILGAAKIPQHPRMQGRDMGDLYLPEGNHTPWRQEFYYEWPGQGKTRIPRSNALIRHDYKYFHYPEWEKEQLFNIKEDPLEEYDVIDKPENAELLKEMKQRFLELQALAP